MHKGGHTVHVESLPRHDLPLHNRSADVWSHLKAVYRSFSVRLGNKYHVVGWQSVAIHHPLGWCCANRLLPLWNSFLSAIDFTLRWHHSVMPLPERTCSQQSHCLTPHSFMKTLKGLLQNAVSLSASISVDRLHSWASKWPIMFATHCHLRWHQAENCVDPQSTGDR